MDEKTLFERIAQEQVKFISFTVHRCVRHPLRASICLFQLHEAIEGNMV